MAQIRNQDADRANRRQERQEEWAKDQPHEDYGDYNFDNHGTGEVSDKNIPKGDAAVLGSYTNPTANTASATGTQTKTVATSGGLAEPTSSDAQLYMQNLLQQGLPPAQIKQQMQQLFAATPTDADIQYAKQGLAGFPAQPNGYPQYSNTPQGKTVAVAYGTKGFQQWMDQQQQAQEAKSMTREVKKKEQESKAKIHMILLQIMMGDIAGALRSYAVLMDRDMRQFTRLIVKKLDAVRSARSTVIRNFARTKPPRAYAGNNPATAARAQDRSAKYTQFVQMNTQLMNELQTSERELTDSLQTQFRQTETFWQTVATFRDETFRTNDRVMTMR